MKIDVYCVFLTPPRRFGMRTSLPDAPQMTFAKVAALAEMTDGQIVRQALETACLFIEALPHVGVQIAVHLDDPPDGFKSGHFTPKFGDGYDDQLAKSIARLKTLLASPKDLQFKRSPNGGNLI